MMLIADGPAVQENSRKRQGFPNPYASRGWSCMGNAGFGNKTRQSLLMTDKQYETQTRSIGTLRSAPYDGEEVFPLVLATYDYGTSSSVPMPAAAVLKVE